MANPKIPNKKRLTVSFIHLSKQTATNKNSIMKNAMGNFSFGPSKKRLSTLPPNFLAILNANCKDVKGVDVSKKNKTSS
ncbi:hypothetical protein WAK64_15735 [Bacillus spongiae]|uniref:Uncharacterized protein n=1 Tax=Bacillus spongiae TaxID=2683610 RepID=A0ABU8HHF9_9BACI